MTVDNTCSPFQILYDTQKAFHPLLYQEATFTEDFEVRLRAVAQRIIGACNTDENAALANMLLNNNVQYSLQHTFNTAVLAIIYAKRSAWFEDDIESLACAALTMNISVVELLDDIVKDQSPLTPLQKSSMQSHVKLSQKLLSGKNIKDRDWLNAVIQHHEQLDGTGLLGMRGNSISKHATVLGLADKYCTLLTANSSRSHALTTAFLRLTVRNEPQEKNTLTNVAEVLGPYHPGIFVKLQNSEIAIVLRQTEDTQYPQVASLGTQGTLSLNHTEVRDTRSDDYLIIESLDPKLSHNRSKLCKLWGYSEPISSTPTEDHNASF